MVFPFLLISFPSFTIGGYYNYFLKQRVENEIRHIYRSINEAFFGL